MTDRTHRTELVTACEWGHGSVVARKSIDLPVPPHPGLRIQLDGCGCILDDCVIWNADQQHWAADVTFDEIPGLEWLTEHGWALDPLEGPNDE